MSQGQDPKVLVFDSLLPPQGQGFLKVRHCSSHRELSLRPISAQLALSPLHGPPHLYSLTALPRISLPAISLSTHTHIPQAGCDLPLL